MTMKLLAKRLTTLLLVLAIPFLANAQQKTISGKVTGENGSPISGASVVAKGSNKGTKTAADGTFTLSVPTATTAVVISSVNFATQTVLIDASNNASVSLKASEATGLTEVVVVGYGTARKKDLTGSVAVVTSKDFNKGVISTPEQLFQGRTPGVTVTASSGEPGAASTINIRGTSSIRGNNDPLYVVDGVPLDGGGTSASASGIEGSSTPKNPLLFLNPNDIESITILKDASSAAIYGSRGANGVILITTKQGKGSKGQLSFGMSTSFSKTASRYKLLNSKDFLRGVIRENIASGTSIADAYISAQNVDKGYNTDWQKEVFQLGISQNYNLGWGINKKGTSVRLSGSYDDQVGIVKTSGLKRITGRINVGQKLLNDKLNLNLSFTTSNVKNRYVANTNNAGYLGSLIGAMISQNPTFPVTNPDGTYYDPGDARNPVEILNYFDDRDNINRTLTNLSASYQFVEGLTYKVTLGLDGSKSLRKAFADPRMTSSLNGSTTNVFGVNYNNSITGNGRAFYQNLKQKSFLVEHTLNYTKSFKEMHNLSAILGYSYQKNTTDGDAEVGWGLNTPVVKTSDVFVKDINNFKNRKAGYVPFNSTTELQSYFGRLNYNYKEKYFLTGTVRIDGSSKFGTNNKYGTFPALAFKWKVLNEDFAAKALGNIFTDLSIRANVGKLGSQDGLGAYDAIDLQQKYLGNSGQVETQFVHQGNKDLKWEETSTQGFGIDFGVLKNRLTGSFDVYSKKTKNLIFFGPVPGGFSASSYYFSNLPGYVKNTGVELALNYGLIKKKNWGWDVSVNMSSQKNELRDFTQVVNTGVVNGQGLSGAYAQTFENGKPLYTWKFLDFQGYDANGFAVYGNNQADKTFGSALPTFTAGLTNNLNWGRWNASVFVNIVKGFYVYNNTANALLLAGALKTAHNVTYDVFNGGESPINPGSVSSRFLEKGDFLRLSNASIGYNFNITNKYIKSLSTSVSGQNLFLITHYSGLDPEVNVDKNINGVPTRGFDYAGYPKARTVTIGFNVGF